MCSVASAQLLNADGGDTESFCHRDSDDDWDGYICMDNVGADVPFGDVPAP